MQTIARWTEPPCPCSYLAEHTTEREYLCVAKLRPDEYMAFLKKGWRRFGHTVFRQQCSGPGACRSLRVDVERFRADRSQRRARKANEGAVRLQIGHPTVTPENLDLFNRFHGERSETRGWKRDVCDAAEYAQTFLLNPFPTQEWCYFLDDILIGVGYVDELPAGLSAIYFARDPAYRDRSLGTWNVLCILDRARALRLPHVYLGYHSDGCPSLQYKSTFRPNQRLVDDGTWRD
jgi:leucyl-tRNA---protein transferase